MSSSLANQLKRFDAYPTTLKDFRVQTVGGALVTGISSLIMLILFISEFHYYLSTKVETELFVDTTRHQKLRVNMDVFFPKLGCSFISIDAVDVSGEQQTDLEHNIFKKRYDENGLPVDTDAKKGDLGDKSAEAVNALNQTKEDNPNVCQSCYGAETKENQCCNTCEDIKNAYRNKGYCF